MVSDEELALKLDEAAFNELFYRYRERIVGYCFKMLGTESEAEEVCADTFVKVLEGSWRPIG